jgi:hypothetical protein
VPFSEGIAPFASGASPLEQTFDCGGHTWTLLLSPNHTFRVQIDAANVLTTSVSPITTVAVSQSSRSIIIADLAVPFLDDATMFRWYVALRIHMRPRGGSQSQELKAELQKRLDAYRPPDWPKEPEQAPGIEEIAEMSTMMLGTVQRKEEVPARSSG